MEAKIVPDGLHINYRKDKPVCLMHDGEIVAWITSDGKFEYLGEVRIVRAVERMLRHSLENYLRMPFEIRPGSDEECTL